MLSSPKLYEWEYFLQSVLNLFLGNWLVIVKIDWRFPSLKRNIVFRGHYFILFWYNFMFNLQYITKWNSFPNLLHCKQRLSFLECGWICFISDIHRLSVMVFNANFNTRFQPYRSGQLYWSWKPKYQEKTTDLPQVSDNIYHTMFYLLHLAINGIKVSDASYWLHK